MIRLNLPLPPSINHYYGRVGNKSFLSKAGKTFREELCLVWLGLRGRYTITGPVRLKVVLAPRNKNRFDIDNRLKPLLDAMQNSLIFNDDSQITDLWATKVDAAPPNGWCHVEITDIAREQ